MAIPVQQYQPETFAQANPILTGMQAGNQLQQQMTQNQFLGPTLAAQLQSAQLRNALSQATLPYAGPQAAANLGLSQVKIPETEAQTALLGGQLQVLPVTAAGKYFQGVGNYLRGANLFNPFNNAMRMQNNPNFQQQLANNPQLMQHYLDLQQTAINNPSSLINMGLPGGLSSPFSANSYAGQQQNNMSSPVAPSSPTAIHAALNLPQTPTQTSTLNSVLTNQGIPPNNLTVTPQNLQQYQNIAQQQIAKTTGYTYSKLPMDQRKQLIAQASGMGIDPAVANQAFMNGETVRTLAAKNGFDPNNLPDPIYPTSQASINLIQKRNQSLQEINVLNPLLTNALAPYSQRFAGYSPKQIAGAMGGDNPDQQAQFLAAKGLTPEMASLRIKAMNGNVGIEAIREVQNASMGNIKSFQGLVSPQVYTLANQYMDQWIQKGAQAANSTGMRTYPQTTAQVQTAQSGAPTAAQGMPSVGMVRIQLPDGRMGNIPASNLQVALKSGARQVQ